MEKILKIEKNSVQETLMLPLYGKVHCISLNKIDTNHNLDRQRIRKLLLIGLIASVMTGIGDFLLGFADEVESSGLAESLMANAPNLADGQLIVGSLLGFLGIFLEGLSYFAIYRLMADAAPRYAHIYRSGIFGYIWLAPVGCHMNIGLMNYAYKNLLCFDPAAASRAAQFFIYAFTVPVWILLCLFWIPMVVVQFKAFAKGLTPFPCKAKWICIPVGAVPALLIVLMIGPGTALGAGIGTMFLSFGNAFTFGGLLATLPSQAKMDAFLSGKCAA